MFNSARYFILRPAFCVRVSGGSGVLDRLAATAWRCDRVTKLPDAQPYIVCSARIEFLVCGAFIRGKKWFTLKRLVYAA